VRVEERSLASGKEIFMHEWALAESVIEAVKAEAGKNRISSITGVAVRVGALQRMDLEIFDFALDTLSRNSGLAGGISGISVEVEECVLLCSLCEHRWGLSSQREDLSEEEGEAIHFIPELAHAYLRCPSCGSPDFRIIEGRGVSVESIEGDC
jgi:hydrogenase nickel incorporation protein HypA/HybF